MADDGSAGEDGPDELFVVEGVFLLHLQLLEQFVEFVIGQFLSQVGHHISKLFDCDGGALRLENGLHGLDELILRFGFLVLAG
jgi:hypothetical protein